MNDVIHPILLVLPWFLIAILAVVYYLSWTMCTDYLRNITKKVVEVVRKDWSVLSIGVTDPKLEAAWLRTAQMMFVSFAHKNHDYGASNISSGGVRGVAVRLGDKVSRLWQLTGVRGRDSSAKVTAESVADTFLDLTNYGIVGFLISTGAWPGGSISQSVGSKAIAEIIIDALDDLEEETQDEILAAIYTAKIAKDISGHNYTVV